MDTELTAVGRFTSSFLIMLAHLRRVCRDVIGFGMEGYLVTSAFWPSYVGFLWFLFLLFDCGLRVCLPI